MPEMSFVTSAKNVIDNAYFRVIFCINKTKDKKKDDVNIIFPSEIIKGMPPREVILNLERLKPYLDDCIKNLKKKVNEMEK